MKCFFVASKRKCLLLLNRNIDNSPLVNAKNCKLYNGVSKRVRDGFARHLKSLWRPYVLQLRRNELKCVNVMLFCNVVSRWVQLVSFLCRMLNITDSVQIQNYNNEHQLWRIAL